MGATKKRKTKRKEHRVKSQSQLPLLTFHYKVNDGSGDKTISQSEIKKHEFYNAAFTFLSTRKLFPNAPSFVQDVIDWLECYRKRGLNSFFRLMTNDQKKMHPDENDNLIQARVRHEMTLTMFNIGNAIFSYLSETPCNEAKEKDVSIFDYFMPQYDISLSGPHSKLHGEHGHYFNVIFRNFDLFGHKENPRFYSKSGPVCTIDGERYRIAITKHTIERLQQRMHVGRNTYTSFGDLFTIFFETPTSTHFLPTQITDKDGDVSAVALWQNYEPIMRHTSLIKEILGEKWRAHETYWLLNGYFPLVKVNGDHGEFFWMTKTFLPPGSYGTPEDQLLRKASMGYSEKEKLNNSRQIAQSFFDILNTQNLYALKWFHNNNVPQVMTDGEMRNVVAKTPRA